MLDHSMRRQYPKGFDLWFRIGTRLISPYTEKNLTGIDSSVHRFAEERGFYARYKNPDVPLKKITVDRHSPIF